MGKWEEDHLRSYANFRQGGSMFAWGQWEIIFPLVVGVFGLGIFMFWSAQAHKEAILPKTMFQDPTALASHLGAAVVGMILWSSIFYMVFVSKPR